MDKVNHNECIQMHKERTASIVNDDALWKEFIEELRKEGGLTSMGLQQAIAKEAVKRASLKHAKRKSSIASEISENENNDANSSIEEDEISISSDNLCENEAFQLGLKKLLNPKETSIPVLSSLASLASLMSDSSSQLASSEEQKIERRASLGRRLWSSTSSTSTSSINLSDIDQTSRRNSHLINTIEHALAMGSIE